MHLARMAWRNLWRHRGRTLLSMTAVVAGVAIIILTKGFVDGMIDSIVGYSINLNSGHVRIIRPEYRIKERLLSLAYPIGESGEAYSALIGGLRGLPGVEAAMGRIRFGLLLVSGDKRQAVLGMGIEAPLEDRVAHLGRFLRAGDGRFARAGRQEIVVGRRLLDKLDLKLGGKVNAVFSTSFGSFKIATFRVVGVMESGLSLLDETTVYIPMDTAMNLLDLEDAVTEIVVFAGEVGRTRELQQSVDGFLASRSLDLMTVPWYDFNEMISYIDKAKVIYFVLYLFLILLASFVVFNTLVMVVAERTREIGLFSALGFEPGEIRRLFLYEGFLLAALGSLIGAVLGGALNLILSKVGFDLTSYMDISGDQMLLTPRLFSSFRLTDLLLGMILGVVVTTAATLLPARRAARMRPTEALRSM